MTLTFSTPKISPYDFVHVYEISRPSDPLHFRPAVHLLTTRCTRLGRGEVPLVIRTAFELAKISFDEPGLRQAIVIPSHDDFKVKPVHGPELYVKWLGIVTCYQLPNITEKIVTPHDF